MEKIHEKYISIEYEKWNNYYKPLEEENKRLEMELSDRDMKLYIHRSWGYGRTSWEYMGKIEATLGGGYKLGFDAKRIIEIIQEESGFKIIKTEADIKREDDVLLAYSRITKIPKWIRKLFGVNV